MPLTGKRVQQDGEPGSLLGAMAGEYKIVRTLGSGGFGTVYEAEHPLLKRRAAVKVLHESRSLDDVIVQRFIGEARAASQIRHPNVVGIFSFGTLPTGQLFYVMDLLEGASLAAYLRANGRLAPETAFALLRPIASALDALHAAGVVHRDVKPANIFLSWESSQDVVPKLLDLGLIKLLTDSPIQTGSDVLMGTPYYMAPEQCQGQAVDARSDVYAMGVIFHELCTGQVPFAGDSASAVLLDHVLKPAPRMTESAPELPAALDVPVQVMLAKQPAQRPASAGEAFRQLEAALNAAGLVPTPLQDLQRPPPTADAEPRARAGYVGIDVGTSSGVGARGSNASGIKRKSGASLLVWGLLALGLLAAGALVMSLGTESEPVGTEGTDATKAIDREPADAPGAARPPPSPSSIANAPSAEAPPPAAEAANAGAASPTSATHTANAAPAPASAAETRVRLLLRGAPDAARVSVDGELLGPVSESLWLARGTAEVELTLKAPGYVTRSLKVVPDHDLDLAGAMQREPRAPRRGPVSRDLENPF